MIYAHVSVHMRPLTSIQHFTVLFLCLHSAHGSGFIISSKVLFYDFLVSFSPSSSSCTCNHHQVLRVLFLGRRFSKSWNSRVGRCVNIRWKNVSLLFCEYIFCFFESANIWECFSFETWEKLFIIFVMFQRFLTWDERCWCLHAHFAFAFAFFCLCWFIKSKKFMFYQGWQNGFGCQVLQKCLKTLPTLLQQIYTSFP